MASNDKPFEQGLGMELSTGGRRRHRGGRDSPAGDMRVSEQGHAEVFVFLLVPDLSMMSLASAIEPLRSLNRLLGREAYRWQLATVDGGAVAASNGIVFEAQPVQDVLATADYLFVCGGVRAHVPVARRYLPVLRRAARRGVNVGALSSGANLLAQAGLLKGYRRATNWENDPADRESFADTPCTAKAYEIDRDRLTCCGGTAAMDMMLHVIAARHGAGVALRVVDQLRHERIHDETDEQRGLRKVPQGLPAGLRAAIEIMGRHIQEPLALTAVAKRVKLSPRQLERLFLAHTRSSPLQYYIRLRVEHARDLLLYSDRPIFEIAVLAGFASTSHFSPWFRRMTGLRPSQVRAGVRTTEFNARAVNSNEDESDGRANGTY